MRYRNPNEVAGRYLYFEYEDDSGNKFGVPGNDTSANSFPEKVREYMQKNGHAIPENLKELIEDQVCARLPKGLCWYEKKAGDQLAKHIHTVASVADKAAGVFGIKTNIETKARGCNSCNKRRQTLNSHSG